MEERSSASRSIGGWSGGRAVVQRGRLATPALQNEKCNNERKTKIMSSHKQEMGKKREHFEKIPKDSIIIQKHKKINEKNQKM